MTNRGHYIVLEGAQGTGKTTQVSLLADRLKQQGLTVKIMREPDSQTDPTARAIRRITQDPHFPINARAEALLYNAARAQSLELVRKFLDQGITCLMDRSYLTTLAIQYYGRDDNLDYQALNQIISFAVADMDPHLTIVLDAPVEILKQRIDARAGGQRFDALGADFLAKVRRGYLWEAKQRKLPVVSVVGSRDSVAESIWQVVDKFINKPSKKESEPAPIAEVLKAKQLIAKARPKAKSKKSKRKR